jgi:hypothetical protein
MGFVIVVVLPTESLAVIVETSSYPFHLKIVLGNVINEESHCILGNFPPFLVFQICGLLTSVVTGLFLDLFLFDFLWHLDQFVGISLPNESSLVILQDVTNGVSMLLTCLVRKVGIHVTSSQDSPINC